MTEQLGLFPTAGDQVTHGDGWALDDERLDGVWLQRNRAGARATAWEWHTFPVSLADVAAPFDPTALDRTRLGFAFGDMVGDWVDYAVGAVPPDVDRWETGEAHPTRDQVRRVAWLTGYGPEWLCKPAPHLDRAIACTREGPDRGCHPL